MEPFIRAVQERTDLPDVQLIGGNGSAALLDQETVIDLDAGTIDAPARCDLPRFRPDGSLRDMDTLVLSTDTNDIDRIQSLAEASIGDGLKISVFGLKPLEDLERQQRQPLRSTASVFLGDRYVTTSSDAAGRLTHIDGYKALYPFQAPISFEAMETFQLSTRGRTITPTAHPGATILNYLTRSISGTRAKDLEKVTTMTERVLTACPDVRAWIHDGPGRHLLELARILHTLRQPRRDPQTLQIGTMLSIAPLTVADLDHHPMFMATDRNAVGRRSLIELARVKSRVVGTVESNPRIVTFWQNHIEDRLHAVIHNDLGSSLMRRS